MPPPSWEVLLLSAMCLSDFSNIYMNKEIPNEGEDIAIYGIEPLIKLLSVDCE